MPGRATLIVYINPSENMSGPSPQPVRQYRCTVLFSKTQTSETCEMFDPSQDGAAAKKKEVIDKLPSLAFFHPVYKGAFGVSAHLPRRHRDEGGRDRPRVLRFRQEGAAGQFNQQPLRGRVAALHPPHPGPRQGVESGPARDGRSGGVHHWRAAQGGWQDGRR